MQKRVLPFLAALSCVLLPLAAHAELSAKSVEDNSTPQCTMTETCQIGISISSIEKNITDIEGLLATKEKDLVELSKQVGLTKFELQSKNYSVNAYSPGNGSNGQWQVSGNLNYTIEPVSKGAAFMQLLVEKGYQPNLNVNAYRNGSCPTAAIRGE